MASASETTEETPETPEMSETELRHAMEGRKLYQGAAWPAILLWKTDRFRPEGPSDAEWARMTGRKLPPRDTMMVLAIMALWESAQHYEDLFARLHALFATLSTNQEAFAKVLREAPARLGIRPVERDLLKFDQRLLEAWDNYEKDEARRKFAREHMNG